MTEKENTNPIITTISKETQIIRPEHVLTFEELINLPCFVFKSMTKCIYRYGPDEKLAGEKAFVDPKNGEVFDEGDYGTWSGIYENTYIKEGKTGEQWRSIRMAEDSSARRLWGKAPCALAAFAGKLSDMMCLDIDKHQDYFDHCANLIREVEPNYPHIYPAVGKPGGHIFLKYPKPDLNFPSEMKKAEYIGDGFDIFIDIKRQIFLGGHGCYTKGLPEHRDTGAPFIDTPPKLAEYLLGMWGIEAEKRRDKADKEHKSDMEQIGRYSDTLFMNREEMEEIFERFEKFLQNNFLEGSEDDTEEQLTEKLGKARKAYNEYLSADGPSPSNKLAPAQIDCFWAANPHFFKLCSYKGVIGEKRQQIKGTVSPYHWAEETDKSGITADYKKRLDSVAVLLGKDLTVDEEVFRKSIYLINNFGHKPLPKDRLEGQVIKTILNNPNKFGFDKDWESMHIVSRVVRGVRYRVYRNCSPGTMSKKDKKFIIANETDETFEEFSSLKELDETLAMISGDPKYVLAGAGAKSTKNNKIAISAKPMRLINDIHEAPGITVPNGMITKSRPVILNMATKRPLLEIIRKGRTALPPDSKFLDESIDPSEHHPTIDMYMKHLHERDDSYKEAHEWVDRFFAIKFATGMYTPIGLFYVGASDAGKNLFQNVILRTVLGLQHLDLLHATESEQQKRARRERNAKKKGDEEFEAKDVGVIEAEVLSDDDLKDDDEDDDDIDEDELSDAEKEKLAKDKEAERLKNREFNTLDRQMRIAGSPTVIRALSREKFVKGREDWTESPIVRLDEITGTSAELLAFYNHFKDMTGGEDMNYELKYMNNVTVNNRVLFILTANTYRNFPMDTGDRRLVVFQPLQKLAYAARRYFSNGPKKWKPDESFYKTRPAGESEKSLKDAENNEYLDKLVEECLDELVAKCLTWHKYYVDYEKGENTVNPKTPPVTQVKQEMKRNTNITCQVGGMFSEEDVNVIAKELMSYVRYNDVLVQTICAVACVEQDNKVKNEETGEWEKKRTKDLILMRHAAELVKSRKRSDPTKTSPDEVKLEGKDNQIAIDNLVNYWKDQVHFHPEPEHNIKVKIKDKPVKQLVQRLYIPGLSAALKKAWMEHEEEDEAPAFFDGEAVELRKVLDGDNFRPEERKIIFEDSGLDEEFKENIKAINRAGPVS